ncbi:MAG: NADH-quinone oxidoreductase subunit L [Planctomycetota bacterium]
MKNYLWLIPLLPAIGATINLLVGRFLGKRLVGLLACGTILGSFILSVGTFFELIKLPAADRIIHQAVYSWLSLGNLKAEVAFLVDPLSIIMLLVVTGVGFLIHVYSIGYMADDKRYARYFGYLNLFVFAMLLLVAGDNLLLMFIGWEGVGLCSYLLIGFWFEKKENAIAGKKAFIVNRIGDCGFILGIFLLFWSLGKIDFHGLKDNVHILTPGLATAIGLLLFVGATGKSAQIPLYVWLPDAMAGPTPVSALIHAATMVTAGVYMIARMNFLYVMTPTAMSVVAIVGVGTAFYAGTIALVQNDIKKVLAYSTISQLGYMFLGVGVGAFAAGIFHLMTHAFFKALLFLGSGSVIHGTGGEQDIRKMGGLKKFMPVTFWTFLIGTIAIAGIPGFSGFFSKDEILWKSFSSAQGHWLLWLVGLAGAALTAFYMFRLVFLTFYGKNRAGHQDHQPLPPLAGQADQEESGHNVCCDDKSTTHKTHHAPIQSGQAHIHESPAIMTVPLVILAVLSVIGGYIGIPYVLGGANHIEKFMEPVFENPATHHASAPEYLVSAGGHDAVSDIIGTGTPENTHHEQGGLELLLIALSVGLVGLSILTAYYCYIKKPHLPGQVVQKFSGLYKLLLNKYYLDEIYDALIIKTLLKLNNLLAYKIDLGVIDRLVNDSARGMIGLAKGSGLVDLKVVDGAVNETGQSVLAAGQSVRQIQTGRLKSYLGWVVGGIIVLTACIYILLQLSASG